MKRLNNLFEKICSIENLHLADAKARKGKSAQYGVRLHDKNKEVNILMLHAMLKNKTYKTSAYKTFTITEPKERLVFCLPYFPDRITHHAIMNILEPVFTSMFTNDTYSCIKGKGIHAAAKSLQRYLKDVSGTQYCLKLDIKKFYPNIDHEILKQLLRRKIKDADLLWLLDEIIDSAEGLPIGNYLSQYFANFYLTHFDHWLKETIGVKYYLRYADDLVFSGPQNLQGQFGALRAWVGAIAQDEGFALRGDKTRLMPAHRRQSVTGLVVNQRPNYSREQFDILKARLHRLARLPGVDVGERARLEGEIHWAGQWLAPTRRDKLLRLFGAIRFTDAP